MKQTGFTLIEVIVVVAISAICFGVLVDLFIGHNRLYKSTTAEINVTSDGRIATEDVSSYIRQASRTLPSYSSYTAGPQVLILQVQSINSSDQLIAGTYDHVVFYLSGSDLLRQVFPNAASARPAQTKRIAASVNSMAFTYNNADYSLVTNVAIDITLQETAGAQTRSNTVSAKARLRNY